MDRGIRGTRGSVIPKPRSCMTDIQIPFRRLGSEETKVNDISFSENDLQKHIALPTIPVFETLNKNKSVKNPIKIIKPALSLSKKYNNVRISEKALEDEINDLLSQKDNLVNSDSQSPPSTKVDKSKKKKFFRKGTEKSYGKKHQSFKMTVSRVLTICLVAVILGVTGYVSFDTWQANNQLRQMIASSGASNSIDGSSDVKAVLGSNISQSGDANSQIISSPNNIFADYKVQNDLPRVLSIDKIGAVGKILEMGVNQDSSLQAPTLDTDAGWYNGSAKPGQNGAIVIDGHASEDGTNFGLFGNLKKIQIGDQIALERGDGVKFTYSVDFIETIPVGNFDMDKLMKTYNGADQGLNIITCTGNWTSDGSTLDHRLLVYATLVN